MKKLILGDIHAHTTWRDIIAVENPDQTIFLGDYFDTFDKNITPKQQVSIFEEIMELPNAITLMGNHDAHYFLEGFQQCSGYNYELGKKIKEIRDKYTLPIIYIDNNIIYSHAGISSEWMKYVNIENIEDINKATGYLLDFNLYAGYNPYGDTISQSPLWIRPRSLLKVAVKGYKQIVGHTSLRNILYRDSDNGDTIYFNDCLPYEYIVINDDNIELKQWNEQ